MRISPFILLIVVFSFSCIFSPLPERMCQFAEHSSQIFSQGDGFFAFDVREYKGRQEKLVIRYFDRRGRQLCINEINYPFSFYNFLVREKDKRSLFLASQSRSDGRTNLIFEIGVDCQQRNAFLIKSDNYETISDIQVSGDDIYICGWAESKNTGILPQSAKPKGELSKIVVEHDMLLAVYDNEFNEKKKVIIGDSNAEYAFSLAKTSENLLFFTGSVMNFEIDADKNRLLKSVSLLLYQDNFPATWSDIGNFLYQTDYNLMPFFLKEYDASNLLIVSMGRMNNSEILGISLADKKRKNVQTILYPIDSLYLPFYPPLIADQKVFLRFLNIRSGTMDRFYVIDMNKSEGVDIKIRGVNRLAFSLSENDFYLYYSVLMKPCSESVYRSEKITFGNLLNRKISKPEMTNEIIINDIKAVKSLKGFSEGGRD
ncbi:MAG: hypothetical protein N3B13_06150 [Deltaproteobacteria bacterium]|nr:hypothetical protein [Deltaproteobacteria bacterium]